MNMETRSTCPYCGVGCGVIIEHDATQITGVRGDPDHPANFGRLCTKGSTLHLTATPVVMQTRRLLRPARQGLPISWHEANTEIAAKLQAIKNAHGPDSIGFYISGQLLTEDYHAFNKLARAVIGTNNIDSNSRLCMSSAVVGYKQSLGADAPPCSYEDIERADCVFIIGANPAWAHPILFRRLEDAKARRPEMKIIVVDPRRTESAEFADLHLQIQPGTDVALLHGMLHAMIWEGWVDTAFIATHTEGFATLKQLVRDMPPREAARICGVSEEQILQAAQCFATSPATLSLYCMGMNQSSSGTAKNTALINLHLAAAQIGRPGAGPFSLTGQPNAMGGREAGGMASLLPGHRDPADAAHRSEIARLWGMADDSALPETPGKTAIELFQAAERGEVKALWIVCTNPAQSLPEQALVRRALERCELVIVQEAFAGTATAAFAHYLLPAATWGEKEGTVTNSERRISRVRTAVPPPGEARADWRIAADIARAMGMPLGADTPEQLWLEHREATRGRDLDITGLSYALLDERGPQQWPFVDGQGTERLYADHRFATADGRARFVAKPFKPPLDTADARRPWSLTTTRLRDQWHGMSRSGVVPRLFGHEGTPALSLNPQDMARRGLAEGDYVRITSARGALVLRLRGDAAIASMQASVPMHWGGEFVGGAGGINALTQPGFCPDAKQPELKFTAVSLEKLALPWRVSGAAWSADRALLRELLTAFDYAHCVPVAGPDGREGWSFEAACAEPPAATTLQRLAAALGLHGVGLLRYADARRGRSRLLRLDGEGAEATLSALLLVGEAGTAEWLLPLWREARPVAPFGRRLLAPEAADATAAAPPRSPQVCNCFDVSEARIREQLGRCAGSATERLAALQAGLRCGTQCGSCLPALRRLVSQVQPEEATT
ncbi:molybdopterin-dependent oxidoreductase [Paucibacter sp. R3-3]|uniref:Molybdopterin-dependent oxidoreductase n=1 Tax=Roseateles agri TaxID=3098619 RepID=A0ABU5DEB6_9BURK|nr:molybdopterin-dependent oxidoreductase [Paucibacter sp. R3-3]MDY0744108.1 molybdopterin-dependent oxidoreductase [Paucibacter sp. R3-3]